MHQERIQLFGMGEAEFMASDWGFWSLCPQWGSGAKPLVRGSVGFAP